MVEMSREEVEELLRDAVIGRIAFARDGEPYCIPMPFLYHGGALYFRLPDEGRKGEMMCANPRVCFEVDSFTPDLSEYSSVIAEGELVEVTDLGEKSEARRLSDGKYSRLRAGSRRGNGRPPQPLEALPVRKLVIHTSAGRTK